MSFSIIERLSEAQVVDRLRDVKLRGFDEFPIYQNADIQFVRGMRPDDLIPAQNYVLEEDYVTIASLYATCLTHDADIFDLEGAILFRPTANSEIIPLLPPIIEESVELDGRRILLISDGMHRVYTARRLGLSITAIVVRNVPTGYPYYAHALPGWQGVALLQELPDGYVKKTYRDPTGYKALFRNYNGVFPGVQKQRKQSNPTYLKA